MFSSDSGCCDQDNVVSAFSVSLSLRQVEMTLKLQFNPQHENRHMIENQLKHQLMLMALLVIE